MTLEEAHIVLSTHMDATLMTSTELEAVTLLGVYLKEGRLPISWLFLTVEDVIHYLNGRGLLGDNFIELPSREL